MNHSNGTSSRSKFSLRLKFEGELEREFIENYNVRLIPFTRMTLLLVIALYSVFGILDIWIVPETRVSVWIIRFAIIVPLVALVFCFSFTRFFLKQMQIIIFALSIVLGYGIIAMIALSRKHELGYLFYYAGLMLDIMAIFILFGLRFLYAVSSAFLIIAGYEVVAYCKQDLARGGFSNPNFPVFLNNNFFFISSFIIGLVGSYIIEFYIRSEFMQKKELREKNELLEFEIALARNIQDRLIPKPDPTGYIYSLYRPMAQVGGDFYDFIRFRDSAQIGIFISDVSGHGVPAAFITSMIKTTILQSGSRKENPAELLWYMNEVLQDQTAGNFITAFYGIYYPETGKFKYSNAGHPQPYLITDQGVSQHPKGNNTALAMFPNTVLLKTGKAYVNFQETLPSRSKLLFVTDGFLETAPSHAPALFFENTGMCESFKEFSGERCDAFINKLYARLVAFRGSDSFEDDVCLICLDVH